jgi:hypothetical protein
MSIISKRKTRQTKRKLRLLLKETLKMLIFFHSKREFIVEMKDHLNKFRCIGSWVAGKVGGCARPPFGL